MPAISDTQMVMIGGAALLGGGLLIYVSQRAIRKTAAAAVDTTGGILSGNNALTEGTPYEGAGILGSMGAAANVVSGGVLQRTGEALGGWLYDRLNPAPVHTIGNL